MILPAGLSQVAKRRDRLSIETETERTQQWPTLSLALEKQVGLIEIYFGGISFPRKENLFLSR